MADKHYETDQYTLSFSDNYVDLHFTWKDKAKQLLSDFLSDYTPTFCELYAAIRKIETGELPSYGAFMDLYSFKVTADGIHIGPGGEAKYIGETFEGRYSMQELKDMMDLHREKCVEIYSVDLYAVDEDYEPIIDGIIEDYPAKAAVEGRRRFQG